ncbi:MAG: Branched-chain amino acid transport ATP-binding protein LivF [uncultured Acidimicrobiales bacterium]|uniref:Branched-chain amino acid transport ATP-binding protein LivF n=1 Tax=uncultured Acidimicrobiales bacterium TaxID=310071 RepID=A0A6J4J3C5_9ACTN|nr:MAG: Branched-chain amino acid transport ATP-binding protein LivF [uncultured Acidimicrobiales bacterium]
MSDATDSSGSTVTAPPAPKRPKKSIGERLQAARPSAITRGAPVYPLVVLFGLNAVDELDRTAGTILLPEIRDHFGLDIQGILTLTSIVGFFVLFLEIPLAHLADRRARTRIAAGGAAAWGLFSALTGLASNIWVFGAARGGANLGRAVNGATHRPLLSDYYDIDARPGVFAFHSAANSVGQIFGPLIAGYLALWYGWQVPFLVFAFPTFVFVLLALRLKEPVRGAHERRAMGASAETQGTEEAPASMAEAWRLLWQVRTLRRIWIATPVISIPLYALSPLLTLFYADELGLDSGERALIAAIGEPFQLVGLILGIPLATRLMRKDPALLIRFIAAAGVLQVVSTVLLVFTRNLPMVIAMRCVLSLVTSSTAPALAAATALIVPPRVRSMGFTVGSVFVIPTLLVGPVIGGLADDLGLQRAIIMLCPMILIGVYMISTAGAFIASDISKVRTSSLAMSEVRASRNRGETKLLLVKDLDVHYDTVQVLFGVNFELDEGEIVALLGTNGAGKSTLLKAISGLVEASAGAVVFDGVDMTYAPPNEVVKRGVIQVPGGKGVFPGLTVGENMKLAGWPYKKDPEYLKTATAEVLGYFPVLEHRWDQAAGNLSGGEQQMLTLGMAFISKPRLLMIDELSLGLAPVVVEQLLEIVHAIQARGTTIILVEQSVNVALTMAETAYFMEKGEIRFHGPTSELLERPDVLRAVFLEGAGAIEGSKVSATAAKPAPRTDVAASVLLEARGLTRSYGGVRAVSDVSFKLDEGSILGIIGPNGAGKTSLFDIISGFLTPDAGSLIFAGQDITDLGPDRRAMLGLGRSFQDARLFPGLTVAETIALALERQVEVRDPLATALGLPMVRDSEIKVTKRVDELIEMLGLQAYAGKFIHELSTGSRRIVDICCVLAHEPRVILFDEPSSGIAQRETEALGPMLLRIREVTGASMLVIEHDMPLITAVSDEIMALDLGQFVTRGPADEVLHDPRVVASYLGTNSAAIARSGTT